jgi:hypothetical protein
MLFCTLSTIPRGQLQQCDESRVETVQLGRERRIEALYNVKSVSRHSISGSSTTVLLLQTHFNRKFVNQA